MTRPCWQAPSVTWSHIDWWQQVSESVGSDVKIQCLYKTPGAWAPSIRFMEYHIRGVLRDAALLDVVSMNVCKIIVVVVGLV